MTDAPLTLDTYQALARTTAIYPPTAVLYDNDEQFNDCNLMYPALGLCGEAGEVAEKVKKIIRDSNGTVTSAHRAALRKELGDVLWYVAALAGELNLSLGDIAQANYDKLKARQSKGTLQGSGDNR